METRWVRKLAEVGYADLDLVGGKAASLGELLRLGIPVPGGYCVTTAAFRDGMEERLKRAILQAFDELGAERVAVRSSAVGEDSDSASWAGQLESYLNVKRDGVVAAVEKCWESVRSERAQGYAAEHGLGGQANAVAVVVQAMVKSDIAGVMFTANPVSGNRQELLVEAAVGLGELLVQGEITPETITAARDGEVVSRYASRQHVKLVSVGGETRRADMVPPERVLSDGMLRELVVTGVKIEQHYGKPQDIEWAIEDGRLFIVQSRPITTLARGDS